MSDQITNAPARTWFEATRVAAPERARLNFDLDVDVCIVGGGLAGLSVARAVAERGWSVALLEAGALAGAASGNNSGFVLPGYGARLSDIVERVGIDRAKQLWELSEQGVELMRRTIEDHALPGVNAMPGWLNVSQTDNESAVRAEIERLRWLGADVEFWPTARVREALPNPRYFNASYFPNAFHIHPLNYALGLAALAEKAGARLFEYSPVVTIDTAGVRKRVVTATGRLRAMHVVLAGGVGLGGLVPRLAATLQAVSTFIMVTEPLGPLLDEAIRTSAAISDTRRADNHYRIVADADGARRLQISGRLRLRDVNPKRMRRGLVADVRRNFPVLGPVEAAYVWGGTFGRTVHWMPQIGAIEPGVWVAGGFGSHGLNTTALAGHLIARAIVDNDDTWRLFSPYELVWAGGRLGGAVTQSVYLGTRPLARVKQALARRNERRKTRQAAKQASKKADRKPVTKPQPAGKAAAMEPAET